MLRARLGTFRKSDEAQDLAEYCLLTALVALIALGIFCYASGGIQGMWSSAGTTLATGNTTTGGNAATSATATTTSQPAGQ
jgi:Flp pilus assembly pilin Flp